MGSKYGGVSPLKLVGSGKAEVDVASRRQYDGSSLPHLARAALFGYAIYPNGTIT